MHRDELIRLTAKNAGATITATKPIVYALFDTIADELAARGFVHILNFGTFDVRYRDESTRISNLNGEEIKIPEKCIARFKPSENLNEHISKEY